MEQSRFGSRQVTSLRSSFCAFSKKLGIDVVVISADDLKSFKTELIIISDAAALFFQSATAKQAQCRSSEIPIKSLLFSFCPISHIDAKSIMGYSSRKCRKVIFIIVYSHSKVKADRTDSITEYNYFVENFTVIFGKNIDE